MRLSSSAFAIDSALAPPHARTNGASPAIISPISRPVTGPSVKP